MTKLSIAFWAFLFSFAAVPCVRPASAGDPKSSGAVATSARQKSNADVKLGDAVQRTSPSEAIADYKAAIEADPANSEAHSKFIQTTVITAYLSAMPKKTSAKNNKKLTKKQKEEAGKKAKAKQAKAVSKAFDKLSATYDHWIKKHPQQAMFYWGKGKVFESHNKRADAKAWFQKATAIDASCAPAYASLSDLAATDGDVDTQRQDAEKALAADPQDTSGVFHNYALTYLSADPPRFRQIVEDRAAKYPDDMEYLLVRVADNAASVQDKEAVMEQIYKLYGPSSAHPSDDIGYTMIGLFNLYAKTEPAKALSFAQQMQKDEAAALAKKAAAEKTAENKTPPDKNARTTEAAPKPVWQSIAEYQQSIVDAQLLFAQEKYADARALLAKNALKPKNEYDWLSYVDQVPYQLLSAQVFAAAGDNQKAYDTVRTALLPQPEDSLEAAMQTYGAKLGKAPAQISADIWQGRESKAKPMTPFDLKQYVTDKDIKLADYRGQVVLVNFWFPG